MVTSSNTLTAPSNGEHTTEQVMIEYCRWCNTAPNGEDKSCTEYAQAMKCAWLPSQDKKALLLREGDRRDELVRRAAPDLLAALKECVGFCKGHQETPEKADRYERVVAAIAKAEGKPNTAAEAIEDIRSDLREIMTGSRA